MAIACQNREIVLSRKYSFEVRTWGMPGSVSFEAFLYNTDVSTYPPERRGGIRFQENVLCLLRHGFKEDQEVTDTFTIKLNGEQVDSLYNLAYGYVSGFEIDNRVEIGKINRMILDGASISVRLGYEGKLMQCAQYRLKGVSQASFGGDKLIAFINKIAPEEFRLY